MPAIARWAGAGTAALIAIPLALMLPERMAPAADHLDPPSRTGGTATRIAQGTMGAAPGPTEDIPADMADIYVWYTDADNTNRNLNYVVGNDFEQRRPDDNSVADDKYVVSLVTGGPKFPTERSDFDCNVMFQIYVSSDGVLRGTETETRRRLDFEHTFEVRFGNDNTLPDPTGVGNWGVRITGLPTGPMGSSAGTQTLEGPVETVISARGVGVYDPDGVNIWAGLTNDPFVFDAQGFNNMRASGVLRGPQGIQNTRDFFGNKNSLAMTIDMPFTWIQDVTQPGQRLVDTWGRSFRFGGLLSASNPQPGMQGRRSCS